MPCAPPSLHRSCCQAPTTRLGRKLSMAIWGSSSAPGYNVEDDVPPIVHAANGSPCDTLSRPGLAPCAACAVVMRTRTDAAAMAAVRRVTRTTILPPLGIGRSHSSSPLDPRGGRSSTCEGLCRGGTLAAEAQVERGYDEQGQ